MCTHFRRALTPAFAFALAVAFPAVAQDQHTHRVPGEKLDNGLGQLPHYRDWSRHAEMHHLVVRPHRVPGEKLDNGLGELKHYRYWADSTGRVRDVIDVASRR